MSHQQQHQHQRGASSAYGMDAVYAANGVTPDAGVNPPISDSSTFTFDDANQMHAVIAGTTTDRFVYGRVITPSTLRLGQLLAQLEGAEAAYPTSSGMAAISTVLLHFCAAGDEIIASRAVYGGTYALFQSLLAKLGIRVRQLDLDDLEAVEKAITPRTRVIYCETLSNPLLEVPDLRALSKLARSRALRLVVDNTFAPLIVSPITLGADVVIHSLTKFVNGMSDAIAGAICGSRELIAELLDVRTGVCLALGGTLDAARAASIAKNLHTLHVRMERHSRNALHVANQLTRHGATVCYPGLPSHPYHRRLAEAMNPGYGFGGIVTVDVGSEDVANAVTCALRETGVARVAVSLGYFRTLATVPSTSTSSEYEAQERAAIGLTPGLVRLSIGLEPDVEALTEGIIEALDHCGALGRPISAGAGNPPFASL